MVIHHGTRNMVKNGTKRVLEGKGASKSTVSKALSSRDKYRVGPCLKQSPFWLAALISLSTVFACNDDSSNQHSITTAEPPASQKAPSAQPTEPPSLSSASALPSEPAPVASSSSQPPTPTASPSASTSASAKPTTSVAVPTSKPDPSTQPDVTPTSQPTSVATAAPSVTPVLPPAEPGSANAVAGDVDAIFVPQKTYTARFKQEHTQKVSGVTKKQSGNIFVQKPNKISFRYDPPNKNRIVSDGTTLKVYVAEDEQMFVSPVQNTEYPGALSFLMGHGLRPSFTFTFNEKAKFDHGPVLLGKPISPTPHYEYVMFYIGKALLQKKDPGTVLRVLIVDAQGNRNRFDFEQATFPSSIDPTEFQFTPPAGTNIKQN